jgi:hypothetical protein
MEKISKVISTDVYAPDGVDDNAITGILLKQHLGKILYGKSAAKLKGIQQNENS